MNPFKGKQHSLESKKSIGEKTSLTSKGIKNSQYGTKWINKENEVKKIRDSELDNYILRGWKLGRVNKRKKYKYLGREIKVECKNCKTSFLSKNISNKRFCSRKCSDSFNRTRNSETAKKLVREGKIKIWSSRKNKLPSYPEKFYMNLLDWNGYKGLYEREHKQGKYFIDIAFIKEKLAIEIDGGLHKLEEIRKKDKRKDEFLRSLGWKIYRVEWTGVKNKKLLNEKINSLLRIIRECVVIG